MDTIQIAEIQNTIVSTSNTEVVSLVDQEKVLVDGDASILVVDSTGSTIVVNSTEQEIILTGMVGPKGDSSDDLIMYSKRIDFISDNLMYRGEALPGSLDSAPLWRIRKIEIISDDIIETWASGTDKFDKIWVSRGIYEYL